MSRSFNRFIVISTVSSLFSTAHFRAFLWPPLRQSDDLIAHVSIFGTIRARKRDSFQAPRFLLFIGSRGSAHSNLTTTLKSKSASAMADQTNQSTKGRKCKRKISYADSDDLLDLILSENTDGNDSKHNRMQKKAATNDKCEGPNHGPDPRKKSRTTIKVGDSKKSKKEKSADSRKKETNKKMKENKKKPRSQQMQ